MVARASIAKKALAALFVLLLGCAPAAAQQKAVAKPANIDRNGALILIRTMLLAVDQANKTGNYTVLRDLGAPGFEVNSATRLAEIFANLRKDNVDLSGVAALDPQLTLLPQIESNGVLHMSGFFPSVPTQVNFDLLFAPADGQWRLFGVGVNLGSSVPVPPVATARPAAEIKGPPRAKKPVAPPRQLAPQEQ